MDMTKIIERVQKLLSLAGNNPNEHEAAAAIEKAYGILAEHNLTMQTVEQHHGKGEDEAREASKQDTNYSENHFAWLWDNVAKLNHCFLYKTRPNPKKRQTIFTIVGRPINTLITTQMALYLCETVKRLANEEALRVGRKDHAFKNAFLIGASARLATRLQQMKFGDTAQQNALVLWTGDEDRKNKEFIATMGVKLRTRAVGRTASYDSAGYVAGSRAAEKVSLVQQVGGGQKSALRIS